MTVAQGLERLAAVDVKQAKPDPTGKARILSDGGGLRLVVRANGAKYWQFKTAKGGKETTLQLGVFPAVSLSRAREEARKLREQQSEGLNVVTERRLGTIDRKAKQDTTFQAVVDELVAVKKKNGISVSYAKKLEGAIKANLTPKLGPIPIQKIEAPYLKEILRPIEARGSLDMLGFILRIAGETFDLAKSNGTFKGDNPAHVLRSNVFAKHKRGHMAALEWSEMNGYMHRLDACRGTFANIACLRLILLTATRPGEARGARWAEFDLAKACWTIPAERMKTRKIHRIPLAKQTVAMLRELHQLTGKGEYLFPGKPGAASPIVSDMAILKAVRRTAGHDNVDAHGFRATFRTHAEDSGLWSFEVMEAALAHGKKDQVVGSYARATHYEQRAKLAQWYADQLDTVKSGGQVIQLQPAAA